MSTGRSTENSGCCAAGKEGLISMTPSGSIVRNEKRKKKKK